MANPLQSTAHAVGVPNVVKGVAIGTVPGDSPGAGRGNQQPGSLPTCSQGSKCKSALVLHNFKVRRGPGRGPAAAAGLRVAALLATCTPSVVRPRFEGAPGDILSSCRSDELMIKQCVCVRVVLL